MDEHSSVEEIRSYLARKLPLDDFGRVSAHVHSCQVCYMDLLVELEKRLPIEIDFDELGGMQGWHLEGEELAAYVAGTLDDIDLECAEFHLEECESCRRTAAAALVERKSRFSIFSRKMVLGWRPLAGLFSSRTGRLAAAAVLLAALLLTMWLLLRPKSEKPQFAGGSPPQTIAPEQVPSKPDVPNAPDNNNPEIHPGPSRPSTGNSTARSEHNASRTTDALVEQELIARDLHMPSVIERLDRTPTVVVRGGNTTVESFNLVQPIATVIRDDRPTFRWKPLEGATGYTVSIYDNSLHLVKTSESLTDTHWMIPNRLQTSTVYTWVVTATKNGQEIVAPAPPARAEFRVIPKTDWVRLEQRISETTSHAARGVLYAESGLLDDAEREFQIQLHETPDDERVKTLLGTVRSWRNP